MYKGVHTNNLTESQDTCDVLCVQCVDNLKYAAGTITEDLSLRKGDTNSMYHDLNNIKEEMDVISMNYEKSSEEADAAVPKCGKR